MRSIFLFFLLTATSFLFAQDTIRVGDGRINPARLERGLRQYLVYSASAAQPSIIRSSIWARRTVDTVIGGQAVLATFQQWHSADSNGYREVYSVNSRKDFSAVTHEETIGRSRKAYNWSGTSVAAAPGDSVLNKAAGFALGLAYPVYNWNLDMETFSLLPLKTGDVYLIPFYDAGYGAPAYVRYQVTGSERVKTYGGAETGCIRLQTRGKAPNGKEYTQTFWFSEKDHSFLKEVDEFAGTSRVKIRLPEGIPATTMTR